MLHLKCLTVIVLSLAVQICRSVETYTAKDVTDPRRFRCHCLLKALTHMRLSKLSFDVKDVEADSILNIVTDINDKEALSILHNSDGVKIGSLWLLRLYIGLLKKYYNNYLSFADERNAGQKLFEIHSYVTELIWCDWDATGCPSYKLNNWYFNWARSNRNCSILKIQKAVSRNNNEFITLVETKCKTTCVTSALPDSKLDRANQMRNAREKRLHDQVSVSLRMENLLLNDLGSKVDVRKAIMNSYDVEVDWVGTNDLLTSTWDLARQVTWPIDHLQNLKFYYTSHFGVFKVVFFRITLVHLLYMEVLEGISMKHIKHYALQWSTLLRNFGKMLRIEDDPDIDRVLTLFDRLANPVGNTPLVRDVINKLNDVLNDCSLLLECNATITVDLNQTRVEKDLRDAIVSAGFGEPEELITQIVANKFMTDLGTIFKEVDFSVVRSLIDYIDEMDKMVNRKLEEPTSSQIEEIIRQAYLEEPTLQSS